IPELASLAGAGGGGLERIAAELAAGGGGGQGRGRGMRGGSPAALVSRPSNEGESPEGAGAPPQARQGGRRRPNSPPGGARRAVAARVRRETGADSKKRTEIGRSVAPASRPAVRKNSSRLAGAARARVKP